MTVDVKVFSAFMKHRFATMWRALLLSQYNTGGLEQWTDKSCSKKDNHCNSHEAEARAWYSYSEEDWATLFCFFDFQLTSERPTKKKKPLTDLRVLGKPTQSASLNRKPASSSKSMQYCLWEREILAGEWETSKPKKNFRVPKLVDDLAENPIASVNIAYRAGRDM